MKWPWRTPEPDPGPGTRRDEVLVRLTGYDSLFWMEAVQEQICLMLEDHPGEVHPEIDETVWATNIVHHLSLRMRSSDPEGPYDNNMRIAFLVAMVFGTWYSRIQHAKAYDPNRPLELRRAALRAHRGSIGALIEALTDETRDGEYFVGQEWNPPYGPSARGGEFV